MLQQTFGENVMSWVTAFKWYKQLKNGKKDMLDDLCEGRSLTSTADIMANTTRAILFADR